MSNTNNLHFNRIIRYLMRQKKPKMQTELVKDCSLDYKKFHSTMSLMKRYKFVEKVWIAKITNHGYQLTPEFKKWMTQIEN